MSNEKNNNKKNQINLISSTIIEEKVGKTEVCFSEIIDLFNQRILYEKGGGQLFKETDSIKLDSIEKNKFKIEGLLKDLYYENQKVYSPITVTFEKGNNTKTYKIFTEKFFNEKYQEMKFSFPLLLIGNSYEKFDPKKTFLFTHLEKNNKIFLITEKKEENYEKFYSKKFELFEECSPFDLTPNFKYYFSSPKNICKMKFVLSPERRDAINSIITFKEEKIHSIYGPFGNGKTTSLLLIAKSLENICYFNLKSLNKNKDNINLWKFDLFLLELFNLFKKKKELFEKIKEKILGSNQFWEAINLSINFCIEHKIDSIFIFDQYKEDIDPLFKEYKIIKSLINDDSNNYVKLIVSSSINNVDIREFIIKKYVDKLSKQHFINDYQYYPIMFQLKDIQGIINILSENKKKIYDEYFTNVPNYMYRIYDSNEEDLNKTVNNIKNFIISDIENFFQKTNLNNEDLCFIIKNYPKIELNFKNNNNNNNTFDKEIIRKFINILPIKYFTLEIKNEEIINIYFYFKLAKLCFLEVLIRRIYKLLETKPLKIPERAIGDLLESIVIENFKNNSIEFFDQVCKVDSIWNITYVKELDINKVCDNNIFIIQESEEAKFIDFGFLLRGETLILAQCKKSLSKKPKEYIKIKSIIYLKNQIYNMFKKYFKCEIKKIKLIYLTGIYFLDYNNNLFHTWSGKEQSFKILEDITTEEKIPLVFYDVQNKKLLIKNKENFEECSITGINSLICNEQIYNYVEIKSDNEEIIKVLEGIKNHIEHKEIELFNNSIIEAKSENKYECNIYEQCLNRNIIPDKRVIINDSDACFLSNKDEDILTTFKINDKKCFSFYDSNKKKMEYKEINKGAAKDLNMKDIKIYFLKKKRNSKK